MVKEKKEKKQKEPDIYMSAVNMPVINYNVYYMKFLEKTLYFLAAFLVGAIVGYLFYGGIGKDEFGNATMFTYICDSVICFSMGIMIGILFLPIRTKQIIKKRKKVLRGQFRDMLEALSTSLNAGKNVTGAFASVYEDLQLQYDEGAYILYELKVILSGVQNNIDIEDILYDLGNRSKIEDIESFANVFKISYRKGGNMKEIIRNTHDILSDKMEIEDEIETIVAGSKNEQMIMIFMPILLVGMIKGMSSDFAANFVTPIGLIATTIAIIMFIVAYFVGQKILDIKV